MQLSEWLEGHTLGSRLSSLTNRGLTLVFIMMHG